MNEMLLAGPCADYEHDLVELLEGSLGPERARIIRLHVDACPRCRAWQAEFATLDAGLAAALPRPALSADFERRLRERLATLSRPVSRADLRAREDREYEDTVAEIRRGARRHALLDALGSAALAACVLAIARGFLERGGLLPSLLEGQSSLAVFGTIGGVVALAALAWTTIRTRLPMLA